MAIAPQRPRTGALILFVATVAPVAVAALIHWAIDQQPDSDAATREGFAATLLGTSAIAASFGAIGAFLLTTFTPKANPDAVLRLRMTAILRALAECAAFGIIFYPPLQVWQASLAVALPEIAFSVLLLRFLALFFEESGNASLARSTRQYVYLYAAYKIVVLFNWAIPREHAETFTLMHRALAPVMEGVIAVLLVKAARALK